MIAEACFLYWWYVSYFFSVMLSVKMVEKLNSMVRDKGPIRPQLRKLPIASEAKM